MSEKETEAMGGKVKNGGKDSEGVMDGWEA